MAHEHLESLARTGGLKAETATPGEVSGLIRSGVARLADAKNGDLSLESRFDLAYNAAHALSLAALRMAGYRSNNRYLVFQCLRHTLARISHHSHGLRGAVEPSGQESRAARCGDIGQAA